ncbi:MAG: class I SAM-dependent methyltransferase [Eubacteriales bacterium]|nr:class I SAM-dependent methyltransferase [Eubacteriales bacterium]
MPKDKTHDDSRARWEANADFWDARMGDESNFFHRQIVRPGTEALLDVQPGARILEIACGNGNFARRMAGRGAYVVACDYSEKLIAHARRRAVQEKNIRFAVCDATDERALLALGEGRPFDKAVANMALMDMSDIAPLFAALDRLLRPGGIFVCSLHHPCFVRPEGRYLSPFVHQGQAIIGQPVPQYYYHRPLSHVLGTAFAAGFALDGFAEVPDNQPEEPVICILRLRRRAEA